MSARLVRGTWEQQSMVRANVAWALWQAFEPPDVPGITWPEQRDAWRAGRSIVRGVDAGGVWRGVERMAVGGAAPLVCCPSSRAAAKANAEAACANCPVASSVASFGPCSANVHTCRCEFSCVATSENVSPCMGGTHQSTGTGFCAYNVMGTDFTLSTPSSESDTPSVVVTVSGCVPNSDCGPEPTGTMSATLTHALPRGIDVSADTRGRVMLCDIPVDAYIQATQIAFRLLAQDADLVAYVLCAFAPACAESVGAVLSGARDLPVVVMARLDPRAELDLGIGVNYPDACDSNRYNLRQGAGAAVVDQERGDLVPGTMYVFPGRYVDSAGTEYPSSLLSYTRVMVAEPWFNGRIGPELVALASVMLHELVHLCDYWDDGVVDETNDSASARPWSSCDPQDAAQSVYKRLAEDRYGLTP